MPMRHDDGGKQSAQAVQFIAFVNERSGGRRGGEACDWLATHLAGCVVVRLVRR